MKRLFWLDNLKVFGIFLVILGHFTPNYRETFSSQWLYQFHMPLFFMISGYLSKAYDKPLSLEVVKIFKRLIVPYFLLVLIGWVIEYTLNVTMAMETTSFTYGWWRTLIGIPTGRVNSMWFVYVLFFLKLLDLILKKIIKSFSLSTKTIVIIFLFIITIIVSIPEIKIPRPINWILASYPFLLVGKVLRCYDYLLDKMSNISRLFLTVSLLTVPVLGIKSNGFVDLYSLTFGNSVYLYYIIGIFASIGMFCLFRLFVDSSNKFIKAISDGTIMIIAFHKIVLYFLSDYNSIFIYRVGICLLVVFLFYFPIILSIKFFPILIGKTNN